MARKTGKCPICKGDISDNYRPFCSKRCADVDLGRWFTEGYNVQESVEVYDDSVVP